MAKRPESGKKARSHCLCRPRALLCQRTSSAPLYRTSREAEAGSRDTSSSTPCSMRSIRERQICSHTIAAKRQQQARWENKEKKRKELQSLCALLSGTDCPHRGTMNTNSAPAQENCADDFLPCSNTTSGNAFLILVYGAIIAFGEQQPEKKQHTRAFWAGTRVLHAASALLLHNRRKDHCGRQRPAAGHAPPRRHRRLRHPAPWFVAACRSQFVAAAPKTPLSFFVLSVLWCGRGPGTLPDVLMVFVAGNGPDATVSEDIVCSLSYTLVPARHPRRGSHICG